MTRPLPRVPPPDEVGPTDRHPPVPRPAGRSILPVLVFALGLMLAVGGVAMVARSVLDGQPSASEVALADVRARQAARETQRRAAATARSRELEAARAAEAPAVEEATPTQPPTPKPAPRRRRPRRRAPKATPTPSATPQPTPALPSVRLKSNAAITDRTEDSARILFTVRPGGEIEGVPVLHVRKPGETWKPFPLKADRGGRFSAGIRFKGVRGTTISWYVTANRGAASDGSAQRPKNLRIR